MFPEYNSNMLPIALDSLLRSNLDAMDYYTSLDVTSQNELLRYSTEFRSSEDLERYLVDAMNDKKNTDNKDKIL